MTVIARTIRATPHRSATETWELIVDLLAPQSSPTRDEVMRVAGIASSLVASEAPKDNPIVVWGNGPRVRLYCLFGDDAIAGDDANEQVLPSSPIEGDAWCMSLPCPEEDLPWVKASLAKHSTRITARKLGDAVEADSDSEGGKTKSDSRGVVDKEAFFRP